MSYNNQHNTPPKILEWILGMMYPDKDHYTSLGDFDELYNDSCRRKNKLYAIFWYIGQLIIAIPYFLKNKIYWGITMFKNDIKIAFRNILKYKTFSFINIFGLSIGLTCALLIYLWVNDEFSYDRFHEDYENIFRVEQDYYYNNQVYHVGITAFPIGPAFKSDLAEVEEFTRYWSFGTQLLNNGKESFYEEGITVVDPTFLKMFNFPLVFGDVETVLEQKNSAVITERTAFKLFGSEDPIGKTLRLNSDIEFIITGVAKNPPDNTVLNFNVLLPVEFLKGGRMWSDSWFNNSMSTYIKVKKDADLELIKSTMDKKVATLSESPPTYMLFPLKDRRLYSYFGYNHSPDMIRYIYIFSSIGIFVLLIACINFMNLSTARSSTREKEIGLKKVIGARRSGLIKQFIGESIFTALIAMLIAVIMISLSLNLFNELIGNNFSLDIWLNPEIILGCIIITLLAGILSGIYPSLILSSAKPVTAVRGENSGKKNASYFRKTLVIVQFTLSSFLIAGTIVVFNQLNFMSKKDLGFNKNNLVMLESQRNSRENITRFNNEIKSIPGVQISTLSSRAPVQGGNNSNGFEWTGKDPELNFTAHYTFVSFNYFDAMGIDIIKGRSFGEKFPSDGFDSRTDTVGNFIINKAMAEMMGVENPIGLDFKLWSNRGKIVGVTDDFNFETLDKKIEPMIFLAQAAPQGSILIRLDPTNMNATVSALEKKWKETIPAYPFNLFFFDQELEKIYKDQNQIANLSIIFSSIAILIALLGLFGLVAFAANKRRKEFGIRKVLGATEQNIIGLVSKEFLLLIILANIIAIPIVYYGMNKWLLNFEYRIDIGIMIFIYSIIITTFLAMFTIYIQAKKAARKNPVENLRTE